MLLLKKYQEATWDTTLTVQKKIVKNYLSRLKIMEQDEKYTSKLGAYPLKEKQYETSLKERGFTNITKIVFAFKGKEVKMEKF